MIEKILRYDERHALIDGSSAERMLEGVGQRVLELGEVFQRQQASVEAKIPSLPKQKCHSSKSVRALAAG